MAKCFCSIVFAANCNSIRGFVRRSVCPFVHWSCDFVRQHVQLATDLNKKIIKNKEQRQYLYHTVEHQRQSHSDLRRSTLDQSRLKSQKPPITNMRCKTDNLFISICLLSINQSINQIWWKTHKIGVSHIVIYLGCYHDHEPMMNFSIYGDHKHFQYFF